MQPSGISRKLLSPVEKFSSINLVQAVQPFPHATLATCLKVKIKCQLKIVIIENYNLFPILNTMSTTYISFKFKNGLHVDYRQMSYYVVRY